jgi:hypothetical protein
MVAALIAILVAVFTGQKWLSAAEAFEKPPLNRRARWYGGIACGLFLIAAGMLLAAAIVDSFKDRQKSELLGGAGLLLLEASVVCGLRYNAVNFASDDLLETNEDTA